MLAAIALAVATAMIIKSGKKRYALVTGAPLAWLALITTVSAWQKVVSADPKLGFFAGADDLAAKLAAGTLSADRIAVAPQLIFNQRLDGWLTIFFTVILWIVIVDMLRVCVRRARGQAVSHSSEAPYQLTRLQPAGASSVNLRTSPQEGVM